MGPAGAARVQGDARMGMSPSDRGFTLAELLDGIVATPLDAGMRDLRISGIHDDSRRVQRGGLFVALRGSATDGARFVSEAAARGAAVVLGEGAADGAAPFLRVPDARGTLARLAARWHRLDDPALPLRLIGVTGTNGKSTTVYMTAAILRAAGLRCGVLGTVQYDLCSRTVRADMTTPGPLELCGHLRECADAGAAAAIMEVSSHALDQKRTDGLRFAAAAFTNLTQDHLDYHLTLDAYRAAKKRLFDGLGHDTAAVVNVDDAAHEAMVSGTRARVLTYSLERRADLTARLTRDTIGGTLYRMTLPGGQQLVLENALVGRHNVYNALAAAGLALALGVEPQHVERGLSAVRNIPGRLQRVLALPDVDVFVDYAHTDDALRNVLSVLRPLARQRLIAVFGCGGDRDRGKRPRMAAAVAPFADVIVVTSDNPRTEDPGAIINDILAGFDDAARRKVMVESCRRSAIHAALAGARAGDVVLIAGKGHEDYQVLGKHKIHFDDREAASEALAKRFADPA